MRGATYREACSRLLQHAAQLLESSDERGDRVEVRLVESLQLGLDRAQRTPRLLARGRQQRREARPELNGTRLVQLQENAHASTCAAGETNVKYNFFIYSIIYMYTLESRIIVGLYRI